ncbi:MAG: NADH-quinone oxidoreductase subunit M [Marmoricola sp.]
MPWLTVLILVPIIGALVLAAMPSKPGSFLPRQLALLVSVATLVLAGVMASGFSPDGGFQFSEDHIWIQSFGAHYALGVDGIGLSLVLLTAILVPIVIIASWEDGEASASASRPAPRWSSKAFFAWMLALEGLAIGVFAATDLVLFYIFFEATLIPIYFLIGGWGGFGRARAALKFLVFSLAGGLIMLASVVGLYAQSVKAGEPSYLISDLAQLDISTNTGRWLFLGFFIAFAIKAPMFPVHTWLPDTTEEATPGTSVLLVSILDKIGTFGMIRFCLGLFPEASHWATPVVIVLALISVIYGALVAIGQNNISRLIAFTSVSHFGLIVLGIFVMNPQGQVGANLYMFNHGLSTAALFLVTGFLIKRRGSALISDFGGVEKVAPVLAGLFLISGLASLSLPGLSPFVSEFLVLVGAFKYSVWVAAFAVPAIVLAAVYILLMYKRTMTGPPREVTAGITDLVPREVLAMVPLLALIVLLGFWPKPLTTILNPAVDATLSHVGATVSGPAVTEGSQK